MSWKNLPEVRHEVDAENLSKAVGVDAPANSTEPERDANVGDEDLVAVMRSKHDGLGVEIYRVATELHK